MPLRATIEPDRRSAAASMIGLSLVCVAPIESRSVSRGPQRGQHTGSAWNRRSDGSMYSARQVGQSGNCAIVVAARSSGRSSTIVYLGPQSVQFTNGCPWRRFVRSNSSRRQVKQVAISAGISARPFPLRLSRTTKSKASEGSIGGCSLTSTASTRASRGGIVRYCLDQSAIAADSP